MQLEESQLYCTQAAILVRLAGEGPWKKAERGSRDPYTQLYYPDNENILTITYQVILSLQSILYSYNDNYLLNTLI